MDLMVNDLYRPCADFSAWLKTQEVAPPEGVRRLLMRRKESAED